MTTEIHGCFFHLSQSILRRLQNLSLISRYRNDEDFFIDVKKIMALALLPIDSVIDGFETLQEQLSEDHEELLAYFENSYIGRIKLGKRVLPKFPIELWKRTP